MAIDDSPEFQQSMLEKFGFKKGDKVENIHASDNNPIKFGKFLKYVHRKHGLSVNPKTGRLRQNFIHNPGKYAVYSAAGERHTINPESLKLTGEQPNDKP